MYKWKHEYFQVTKNPTDFLFNDNEYMCGQFVKKFHLKSHNATLATTNTWILQSPVYFSINFLIQMSLGEKAVNFYLKVPKIFFYIIFIIGSPYCFDTHTHLLQS